MITLENGKFYRNGRGDFVGPMDERDNNDFSDPQGRLYHPNGRQWNHTEGSTGNIVSEERLLRCYCCGLVLGNTFSLVYMGDKIFTMIDDHALLINEENRIIINVHVAKKAA